jgi:hypothetical protein
VFRDATAAIRSFRLHVFLLILASATTVGFAQAPASVTGLDALLERLHASATPEAYRQIAAAVAASSALRAQLNELTAAGSLAEIRVIPQSDLPPGKAKFFHGFTDGTRLVFSNEFLQELLKNRPFDVVNADDVPPDNTVFVLGHLAYHLHAGEPRITRDQTTDQTAALQAFVAKRLQVEATAYIQGWNDMIDAATHANQDRPLSPRQVGQLFMNARYRFAFSQAIRSTEAPLRLLQSGAIEVNEANTRAISTVLKHSQIADVE